MTIAAQHQIETDDGIEYVPESFQHDSIRGCRLPGWEDLNATRLAAEIGIGAQHIREVLTGRCGIGLGLLRAIAKHLNVTLDALIGRIEVARKLDARRRKERNTRFG